MVSLNHFLKILVVSRHIKTFAVHTIIVFFVCFVCFFVVFLSYCLPFGLFTKDPTMQLWKAYKNWNLVEFVAVRNYAGLKRLVKCSRKFGNLQVI